METQPKVNIEEVWNHYFKHRDIESRNILLVHYLPLVKYTAIRLHARFPKCVELDDLYSAGIEGLIDAIEKFNPKANAMFETYSVQRIAGSIRDDIRKKDWVSRLVRTRAKKLQEATQRLEAIWGRYPTEEELADELGINRDQFYCFQRDANASVLISLDANLSVSGEDFTTLDIISDPKGLNSFSEVHKRDFQEYVKKGLSREEQIILLLYYFEEMTMKEIGATLGISESRVSQLHLSIITRLREQVKMAKLSLV
jgi:RNA polymerase sigma factor for flagellar operon FliA